MQHMTIRQSFGSVTIAAFLLLGSGCTSFWKHTRSDITIEDVQKLPDSKKNNQAPDVTLVEAQIYAEKVRSGYHKSIDDQIFLEDLTNLAFIPIAGLASFYGISSAHTDVVLGLSIAGAGTYILGQTLTSRTDQLIYAGGMLAISCVQSSFAPLTSANVYYVELVKLVGGKTVDEEGKVSISPGEMQENIQDLEGYVPAIKEVFPNTTYLALVENLIREAKQALADGRKVRRTLDQAGQDFSEAVKEVQGEVAKALVENRPDAGALRDATASALRKSIPAALRPQPPAPVIAPTKSLPSGGAQTLKQSTGKSAEEIANLEEKLLENIRAIEVIVDAASVKPNAAALEKCAIDADEFGLTLRASVGDSISVTRQANTEAKIGFVIAGGRKPYAATWEGQIHEELTTPLITSGGQLTASIDGKVPAGTYRIVISDLNANSISVTVNLIDGAGS